MHERPGLLTTIVGRLPNAEATRRDAPGGICWRRLVRRAALISKTPYKRLLTPMRSAVACLADPEASGQLFDAVFGVLWLNGNANGHSTFLLLPQLLNFLILSMATVLMSNCLGSSARFLRAVDPVNDAARW
jgi:hypothetical protein